MFSLKYKNLIKDTLFEELTPQDIENNANAKNQFEAKLMEYSNSNNKNNKYWFKEDNNSLIVYVFNRNRSNVTKRPMEIAIDVITLEYDGNRTTIQFSFKENPTYHPQGVWNEKLNEKYGNEVSLDTIKSMSDNLFNQFRTTNRGTQRDRVDVKTQFDKETVEDLNRTEKADLMKIYREKMKNLIIEDIDKNEHVDEVENPNIDQGNKDGKGKSFVFNPSNIIKDDAFRTIPNVKATAEKAILDFEKERSKANGTNVGPEEMAAAILYSALQTVVSNNPCTQMRINPDELYNKSKEAKEKLAKRGDKTTTLPKNLVTRKLNYDKTIKAGEYNLGGNASKTQSMGEVVQKMLSVNPPELLSPIAFARMNIPIQNWSTDINGISAKVVINHIFGKNLKSAEIRYFPTSNEPLVDSQIRVKLDNHKYARIGISTKGGLDGLGAAASLASIFKYLLDKEVPGKKQPYNNLITDGLITLDKHPKSINDPKYKQDNKTLTNNLNRFIKDYCNKYRKIKGNNFFTEYLNEIMLLILIGATKPAHHQALCNIVEFGARKLDPEIKLDDTGTNVNITSFCKKYNKKGRLSELIMRILDIQKYDFAQVNCKPSFTTETYKYDYFVQYPAKFVGKANLEAANKGIRFHIVGN